MTRPKLILGVLAAACVGTLLWYAWLILAADLPRGATIATWVLWLFSAAAVVTLVAYAREFLAHREAVGREASWKPLPSLVLLWIGGLTAMVSFSFVLPDKAPADGADDPAATSTSLTGQQVDSASSSTDGTRTATTASRSSSQRTPVPVSTAASTDSSATSTGSSSSTSTDASTSSTSSTATKSKPTKTHPGTGSPTRSTTSTGAPLVSVTLPPPPG